jgi:hypothetical protein
MVLHLRRPSILYKYSFIKIQLMHITCCVNFNEIKIKVAINTPTCFGSRRNHLQGVSQCLAKAIYMVFLCTSMVTQSMVWRHVSLLCWCVYSVVARWKQADMPPYHWLRHHRRAQKNHIYSLSQALGDSLKMVTAWTETCWSVYCDFNFNFIKVDATSNVRQLDFNKRVLILEMHGTNIKKKIILY